MTDPDKSIVAAEAVKKMLMMDAQDEARENGLSLPFLSLYISNRSTSVLSNGKNPNDGWFYYTKTQEQFENPNVTVCHVSRGFRVLKKDDKGQMVPKYMHIVSGLLNNDVEKPFFMTISGSKRLEQLWEFRGIMNKHNAKGIPSYAIIVNLSSENVKTKKPDGQSVMAKIIKFAIATNADGSLITVDDYDLILKLREAAIELRAFEKQYMDLYEVNEDGERVLSDIEEPIATIAAPETTDPVPAPNGKEDVNPNDIPF